MSRTAKQGCWLDRVLKPSVIKELGARYRRGADLRDLAEVATHSWAADGFPNIPPHLRHKFKDPTRRLIWASQLRPWLALRFGLRTANKRRLQYRHPRTGEKRKQQQPLRIDRTSQDVKDLIVQARAAGETWANISDIASAASGIRLPRTTLQRWYDLRVEQRPISHTLQEIISLLKSILEALRS